MYSTVIAELIGCMVRVHGGSRREWYLLSLSCTLSNLLSIFLGFCALFWVVYYIYPCIYILPDNTTGFNLLKDILHLPICCIIWIKTLAGAPQVGSNAGSLQFAYIGYIFWLQKTNTGRCSTTNMYLSKYYLEVRIEMDKKSEKLTKFAHCAKIGYEYHYKWWDSEHTRSFIFSTHANPSFIMPIRTHLLLLIFLCKMAFTPPL